MSTTDTPAPLPLTKRFPILRFLRWFFTLRILGRFALAVTALITLVALCLTLTSYSGKRAWDAYRKAQEAKGEKFDVKSFIPPAVPDDKNFAMTPLLAPLFDYTFTNQHLVWRDTNANQRAFAITLGHESRERDLVGWREGNYANLKSWQAYFRSETSFPMSTRLQTPAEDVLKALTKFDSELEELQLARQRPFVRFNLHYDEGIGILLNHLSIIRSLSKIYTQRALAELETGKTDAALKDVDMSLFMSDALHPDPLLVNHLIRISQIEQSIQPIFEGLGKRQWTDAQIITLQSRLKRYDLLADYEHALRFERAQTISFFGNLGSANEKNDFGDKVGAFVVNLYPWAHHNQINCAMMIDDYYLSGVDSKKHLVVPAIVEQKEKEMQARLARRSLATILTSMVLPRFGSCLFKTAACQSALDQAQIACALERYRMAHNEYPETLIPLEPKFMDKIPMDVVTGKPMIYKRTDGGHFILYSIGWNGVDDKGAVVMTRIKPPRMDLENSDWIWRYPEVKL